MTEARVIHFEIVGKDGAALQRYYSDLFGWALDTEQPGRLRDDAIPPGPGLSSASAAPRTGPAVT